MAKGQVRRSKEAKKPKSENPKGEGSAYKQAQGKGTSAHPIKTPGKNA